MILVDACVIFDHTRGTDARLAGWFAMFPVVVCGVTRAEVLAGARNPADRAKLLGLLGTFGQLAIPEPVWDAVGDNLSALRAGGVTVPFPDVVLATLAITHDIELWTRDKHFAHIQRILMRLKLFVEPP